jgi:hypothetical protein
VLRGGNEEDAAVNSTRYMQTPDGFYITAWW